MEIGEALIRELLRWALGALGALVVLAVRQFLALRDLARDHREWRTQAERQHAAFATLIEKLEARVGKLESEVHQQQIRCERHQATGAKK